MPTDEARLGELLNRACRGEGQAWQLLLEPLRNYWALSARVQIGRCLQGNETPSGIVREAFVAAFRSLGRFSGTSAVFRGAHRLRVRFLPERVLIGSGAWHLPVFLTEAGGLWLRGSDGLYRCEELSFQLGDAWGQPVVFAVAPRIPQLHGAGKYASSVVRPRRIAARQTHGFWQILGGEGLTRQSPLFKVTTLVPLPWGSGGHCKSKNPVNNHAVVTGSPPSPPFGHMPHPGGAKCPDNSRRESLRTFSAGLYRRRLVGVGVVRESRRQSKGPFSGAQLRRG